MIRMEDAGASSAMLHLLHAAVARCGGDIPRRQAGASERPPALRAGQPLRLRAAANTLGMSRIRVAYTAGAAIGPDLFRFYRSIGINLKQLYGQTETCAYVCLQPTAR